MVGHQLRLAALVTIQGLEDIVRNPGASLALLCPAPATLIFLLSRNIIDRDSQLQTAH
jgi:hypothetical protein